MRNVVLGLGLLAAMSVSACAADEVKIEKVSLEGLAKAVAGHKGKIVVIDIWATFCAPCKEKFPHMVELHNKLKDQGVVFISLSVDEPADIANALEKRSSRQLKLFVKLMEPVMLLFMAAITLVVVAGLLLPVFKMGSAVG